MIVDFNCPYCAAQARRNIIDGDKAEIYCDYCAEIYEVRRVEGKSEVGPSMIDQIPSEVTIKHVYSPCHLSSQTYFPRVIR